MLSDVTELATSKSPYCTIYCTVKHFISTSIITSYACSCINLKAINTFLSIICYTKISK